MLSIAFVVACVAHAVYAQQVQAPILPSRKSPSAEDKDPKDLFTKPCILDEVNEDGVSGCSGDGEQSTDIDTPSMLQKTGSFRKTAKRYPTDLLTCPGEAVLKTKCMTKNKYLAVANSIKAYYDELAYMYSGFSGKCKGADCPQDDFASCILRLAGHDFMDFNPDGAKEKGGSDGCIDFEDTDNKGLEPCLVALTTAYQEHCTTVSMADFFVIAAEEVMRISRANLAWAPKLDFKMHFRYGRQTSMTCGWNIALPDAEESCKAVEETFVHRMGLSWRLSAALMGAHTLGRARAENSGYDGFWGHVNHSRKFNNNYFASIVVKGWMPRKQMALNRNANFNKFGPPGKKVQWVRSDAGGKNIDLPEMMLNTDMCLMYSNGDGEPVNAARDVCCTWAPNNGYPMAITGQAKGRATNIFRKIMRNTDDKSWCGMENANPFQSVRVFHAGCCNGNIEENCGRCAEENVEPRFMDVGKSYKLVVFKKSGFTFSNGVYIKKNAKLVGVKREHGGADFFTEDMEKFLGSINAPDFEARTKTFNFQEGEAPWYPGLRPARCNDLPRGMGGPAEKDVIEFAAYDNVWINAYVIAWKKATENGHEGLEHLKDECEAE